MLASTLAPGCSSSVNGLAGEIPVAAAHDSENGWVFVYAAQPQTAAATKIEWRLYKLSPGGGGKLAWSAPGEQTEGLPFLVSAQLVTRDTQMPAAWVAANYPGGQYRIHRFENGGATHWDVPGDDLAPGAAGMHVATSPEGDTWLAFEQPRYWTGAEPARELFSLPPSGGPARNLNYDTLWVACGKAACGVLMEKNDQLVLEKNGVAVLTYPVTARSQASFRAVCNDHAGDAVLLTEDRAFSLVAAPVWPTQEMRGVGWIKNADGSVLLPEKLRSLFSNEYGRLECTRPGHWLWISDSNPATYQIDFTTATVAPMQPAPPPSPNLLAYYTGNRWELVGARYEDNLTLACASQRNFVSICNGEYERFSFATYPLAVSATSLLPNRP